ncbi:hypothetical protein HPB49_026517 [Dermacentor silvarum]|nr:hypothetical protein HPB49_026517 [Dermacentor silvarum]
MGRRLFKKKRKTAHQFGAPPQYDQEMDSRLLQPGVAVGLAWTAAGGEIMFVEASRMEGDGQLVLTGQLGDVMKESAKLALNWLRIHADKVGGIKDKVLAAHRAGMCKVILPKRNKKDLQEVPASIKEDLTFCFVTHIEEVLQEAFEGGFPDLPSSVEHVLSKL